MPLTPPKLDDRDFESLFQEARSRIPLYLPEWTDWNESDPGITLLQLHAWLTETVLHRLNQLPELNYLKFLQLLGVEQRPARPAEAMLTFTLKGRFESPDTLIPKGTVVGVSDRDLPEPVFFETERTATAISARLALLAQLPGGAGAVARDVTAANELDAMTIHPFCGGYERDRCVVDQQEGASLLLGFSSPLPFSRQEVGLHLVLAQEGQAVLAEPPAADCDDGTAERPEIHWEWWDGTDWAALDVTADETLGLTRSGQVFVKVGGQIPAVAARAVSVEPVQAPATLDDVAGIAEWREQLADAGIRGVAELAALSIDELCDAVLPADATDEDVETAKPALAALLADARRLAEREEPLFYWLRMRLGIGPYRRAPRLDRVLVNSVLATAARTVANEVVGRSNGRPNQVLPLGHAPVLADPPLALDVPEAGRLEPWEQVPDFGASGPDSRHYVLNRTTGEITFGDGRRGRIPPAEPESIVARAYRHGGGRIGNVGAHTITDLLTPVHGVDQVTNHRAAVGGEDEEALDDTKVRAPRELFKTRDRAVTLEDFEVLARATPGALVGRVHAEQVTEPDGDDGCPRRAIRIIVVPSGTEPKPAPSEQTLRLVCRHLDARRLVTTRLRIAGPAYRDLDVLLDVLASPDADLRTVKNALGTRLAGYFHPLTGGPHGRGLPFGGVVGYSEVVREIMAVAGVTRIRTLRLRKFLRRHADEEQAAAAAAGDVQAEADEFDVRCALGSEVVTIVEPDESPGGVRTTVHTAAIYDCCDVPLASGELAAMRLAEITVAYDRGRRA